MTREEAQSALILITTPYAPRKTPFSRSRYPYTYAYDHVRSRTAIGSRAEAGGFVKEIAEVIGIDHEGLIYRLADQYLRENNIDRPEDES